MVATRGWWQIGAVCLAAGTLLHCSGNNQDAGVGAPPTETVVPKQPEAAPPGSLVQTLLDGTTVSKYVEAMPRFTYTRQSGAAMTVDMVQVQQKLLPASFYTGLSLPYKSGTYQWAYNVKGSGARYPANTIEVQRNAPLTVTYTTHLADSNGSAPALSTYLVTDQTLHWADPLHISSTYNCLAGAPLATQCLDGYSGPVPTVAHLHGGEVPSQFDGHPDAWFTPNGLHGPGYVTNVYTYPNTQESTMLWYHDHTLGRVRQNVYAGLAGAYIIRDSRDTGLSSNALALPNGGQEFEMVIADRQFDTNGQLYFPSGAPGNPDGLNGPPPNPETHPYWNPEFFGDVILVNGKSWPYTDLQPRRYRLRILNGSNARFYHMALVDGQGNPGPALWKIGGDGGLLDAPVKLADPNDPNSQRLFLAPGERADVIVDFAGQSGKSFTLVNDAVAPFPSGDPPDPNTTGQIMQFRIDLTLASKDKTYDPSTATTSLRAAPAIDVKPTVSKPADLLRQLVLVEVEGDGGPMEVLLNNSHWDGLREGSQTVLPGSLSTGYGNSATETPKLGTTEVWEIANLTEDAHPIHVHLVQFQVINHQPLALVGPDQGTVYEQDWISAFPGGTFNGTSYAAGTFIPGFGPPNDYGTANAAGALGGNLDFSSYLAGPVIAPDPNDVGWKDTIKVLPKEVTRIALRWAPQSTAQNAVSPGTNAFSFDPTTGGPGYVWHCHIIDHEDNEMMRPMVITH
jgi:FtsP/CotA-like multicopper oxidase with cupredoxin domain